MARTISWTASAIATAVYFAAGAHAQTPGFDIPAGPVGQVAGRVGLQAGITVTVPDPEIARRLSPGVRGRLNLRQALRRALAGTGAEAEFHGNSLIRIVRARITRRSPRTPVPPPSLPQPREESEDIIVTGSKQNSLLDRYPASVKVIQTDAGWLSRNGSYGAAAIMRLVPSISTTNLGQGRDKIFIRGIADSSFSGPTQAATGQYLGDVRLTYDAPDPALNLYDMQRVEIMAGPQAPLYGSGSLGGIIRFVPNEPDLRAFAGTASMNLGTTRMGKPSADSAVMVNLPIGDGHWAARVVASATQQGGYIDAPAQGRKDINRTRTDGYRLLLRGSDLGDWSLDLGLVSQNIRSDTGQYTLRGSPGLVREEPIAQPFRSNYKVLYFTLKRPIGAVELVSTSSGIHHQLTTVADASALIESPLTYREMNDISIFAHETRVSGGGGRAPWVLGTSLIYSKSLVRGRVTVPDGQSASVDVVNENLDAALYGQLTRPIGSALSGTIGGRVTYARTGSFISDPETLKMPGSVRHAARLSRMWALNWQLNASSSAYFRHDHGFRAGGLAAFPTLAGLVAQSYRPDTLDLYELGIRAGDFEQGRVALRAAIFRALWHHMQADLLETHGLPFTANIGNGRIDGLDAELRWRPRRELLLTASTFLNDSRLHHPAPGFESGKDQSLPNVAKMGARISASWQGRLGSRAILIADASLRYVGESRLGIGSILDIQQGDYAAADLGARIDFGPTALSVNLDNLTDSRGNTFAFGNPFTVSRRDQVTPLRPRTLRIGVEFKF